MFEYVRTYLSFIEYVKKCKNIISDTYFTMEDAKNIDIDNNLDINYVITKHRIKMIDLKLEHTMRMIEQVIKINANLGLKVDLDLVVKIAVLYHDIGRFRQATWSNSYSDIVYKNANSNFLNHGEDGSDIFLSNDFNVERKYIPIIGKTIFYHQNHHTKPELNYKFDSDLSLIDISKIATGKFELNEAEWQVASLIVQLVADLDKTDILYQHLSNDFRMIRDYVFDYSNDSLDNIAKKWGISKSEIIEYNKIIEKDYKSQRVKIPIKNVPLEKLEVPNYMKDMFFNNSWPELPVLIKDDNWNFITMLWWRISYFLNQITFNANLINIQESRLLEEIYERIPGNLIPLVEDAFIYAKEVLVNEKIEKNKGNIYLKVK